MYLFTETVVLGINILKNEREDLAWRKEKQITPVACGPNRPQIRG